MEQDRVLWENEVKNNRILAYTIYISFGVFSVFWVLMITGIFEMDITLPTLIEGWSAVVVLVSGLTAWHFRYARPWIKYMLMTALIVLYAGIDSFYGYNVDILTVVPLIIASRYYSKRFTLGIAGISVVAFTISALYGANHGLVDFNILELPQGTVLRFEDSTWLEDALANVEYDRGLLLYNTILYNIPIRLGFFLIVFLICSAISKQGRAMIHKQRELTQTATRVSAELDMANNIQASMLPNDFSVAPRRHELELYATMNPAREVGGDFYDFFLVSEDKLAMVVADVSGKGVPAALFMMQSKIMLKAQLQNQPNPAIALRSVNAMLSEKNEESMFVTAWAGVLDLSEGTLRFGDAGHEQLALKHEGKWELIPKEYSGLPLAMLKEEELNSMGVEEPYQEQSLQLTPGDLFFQYTDGVTEATAADGSLFSEERLLEALNGIDSSNPREIILHVRERIDAFVGEAEQFDDITMLCVAYHGEKSA